MWDRDGSETSTTITPPCGCLVAAVGAAADVDELPLTASAAFMPRFINGSCPTCVIEPAFGGGLAAAVAAGSTNISAAIAASALHQPDPDMSPPTS